MSMRRAQAVTFVIMAGGRGERLWPLVRSTVPKVCLSLDGTRSLLGATIDRVRPVVRKPGWLIVTTRPQADAVTRVLPRALKPHVLVEPEAKNTAACLTVAASVVARRNPETVMVALPADHWIDEEAAFRTSLRVAIDVCRALDV